MIKKFSPRAHRLLSVTAREIAKKMGSNQLVPEHMLIGLIQTVDCVGYAVLRYLKISTLTLHLILEKTIPLNNLNANFSDVLRSRRLQTFLDAALAESRSLRRDYIGTEHFLLAAVKEEQSAIQVYLQKNGISAEDVKSAIETVSLQMPSSAHEARIIPMGAVNMNNPMQAKPNPQESLLDEHCYDLTKKAQNGELDPVVGRKREIQRVIQILSRRNKNNPVLVGEPGVGKTAIAEGLAQCIADERVPNNLLGKRLLSLDLASVIAGTKYRGEFEKRIKKIMKEISEQKNIILFIDELHTIIGAGGAEGSMDASNMLKPALSRGDLQCIGATTHAEYRKYFERDAALERRFQVVQVAEPSDEDTYEILEGIKKRYEEFHEVEYADDVIETIVRFSKRYITDRFMPDKAIDILDETGAMKKISENVYPEDLAEMQNRIEALTEEKKQVIQTQNYESAAQVRDELRDLKETFDIACKQWKVAGGKNIVTVDDVFTVISHITHIPSEQLDEGETSRLIGMEAELHKTVISQDEAIRLVSSAVRRARAGVSSTKRPLGSFIFLGPTGVGKTLLAKTLARFLFGFEDSLIRIDMSDYMEKHNSSRLVGAPPGYVGYEEGGVLTEKVRRNPYAVILLDEIEKAHPDVFNLLLQILEEGEILDSLGHVVNFRNTVIIMTSNAGVRQISNENRLGFSSATNAIMNYNDIKADALNELKKLMSPELINRIDDTVVFTPLTVDEVSQILDIQMAEFAERLSQKNIGITLRTKAKSYLIERGYDPSFGARPMRRIIQREIEDPLATKIIAGECKRGDSVIVDYKASKTTDGMLILKIKKETASETGKDKIEIKALIDCEPDIVNTAL